MDISIPGDFLVSAVMTRLKVRIGRSLARHADLQVGVSVDDQLAVDVDGQTLGRRVNATRHGIGGHHDAAVRSSREYLTSKIGAHLTPDPSTSVPTVKNHMRILPTSAYAVVIQNA
jgi:hypothetical protein